MKKNIIVAGSMLALLSTTNILTAKELKQVSPTLQKDINTIRSNFFNGEKDNIDVSKVDVEKLMNLINAKGQFTDLKYAKVIDFFQADKSLKRLRVLSQIYVDPKSKYFENEKLRKKIFLLLDYWCELNATSPNWWCRDIGYPKRLTPTVINMYQAVSKYDLKLRTKIANYFINDWHRPIRSESNSAQIGKFALLGALYDDRSAIVKEVSRQVKANLIVKHTQKGRVNEVNLPGSSKFKVVHERVPQEGVLADNMYNAHGGTGSQLYWAGYGAIYLDTVMWFRNIFRNTQYAVTQKEEDFISNLYLDSISWIVYNKSVDFNNIGRRWQEKIHSGYFINSLKGFIPNAPEKYKKELQQTLKRFIDGKTDSNYLSGNREFWNFDYMVHRRKNYAISSRMTSKRTVCNESGLGAGLNNYYTGSGVTYIKTTGKEYTYNLAQAWNWRKLPGITALQDEGELPIVNWGNDGTNGDDYAVTVSDKKNGFAAFKFDRHGVTANKAYFFFDEGMLALGNSINVKDKNNKFDVFTTVNQCVLNENSLHKIDDKAIIHSDIAYISLGDKFKLETAKNLEAKASKNIAKGQPQNIFTLAFNHKNNPQNASYQYFVAPNIDNKKQLEKFDTSKLLNIIKNSKELQIVENIKENALMIVAYKKGRFSVDDIEISVSAPLAAMLKVNRKNGKIITYISNPYGWDSNVDSATISLKDRDLIISATAHFGKNLYRGQTIEAPAKISRIER